jgi:hypothetical protein
VKQQATPVVGIEEQVLLFNSKTNTAFHSFTPQEARQAIAYIKRKRSGIDELTPEQRETKNNYQQFMLHLHEKGTISTRTMQLAFDLDPDEEERLIQQEREARQQVSGSNQLEEIVKLAVLRTVKTLRAQADEAFKDAVKNLPPEEVEWLHQQADFYYKAQEKVAADYQASCDIRDRKASVR